MRFTIGAPYCHVESTHHCHMLLRSIHHTHADVVWRMRAIVVAVVAAGSSVPPHASASWGDSCEAQVVVVFHCR